MSLRWSSLRGAHSGQHQKLPGDLSPPLQVAGHDAGGPTNLGLANPTEEGHSLLSDALCDSSIRKPDLNCSCGLALGLPLTIQMWRLSMLALCYHLFLLLLVISKFWRPNQLTGLMVLRIEEADKTSAIC